MAESISGNYRSGREHQWCSCVDWSLSCPMSQTTMGVNTLKMSQTRVSALSHQIYLGTAWSSSLELSKFSLGHPEDRPTCRVRECMKPLARKDMGLGRASKVSVRASPCPLRWKSRHQASTMSHASASNDRRSSFEIISQITWNGEKCRTRPVKSIKASGIRMSWQ